MYEATYFNGLQERQMKSIKEIYRIGRGPSSSHTMGPESAAKMFINEFPSADRYEAVLYGSLAKTGKGHGTDRVLRETFAPRVLDIKFDMTTTDIPTPTRSTSRRSTRMETSSASAESAASAAVR